MEEKQHPRILYLLSSKLTAIIILTRIIVIFLPMAKFECVDFLLLWRCWLVWRPLGILRALHFLLLSAQVQRKWNDHDEEYAEDNNFEVNTFDHLSLHIWFTIFANFDNFIHNIYQVAYLIQALQSLSGCCPQLQRNTKTILSVNDNCVQLKIPSNFSITRDIESD